MTGMCHMECPAHARAPLMAVMEDLSKYSTLGWQRNQPTTLLYGCVLDTLGMQ